MEFKSFASGSSGNSYFVSDGETKLLIEAGIKWSEIKRHLDFKIDNIKGILLSHSHKDHSKAINYAMNAGIDAYMSDHTARETKASGHRLKIIKPLQRFEVGTFSIVPFPVKHDVFNYGYFLTSKVTNQKLLFITDTYYTKYKFPKINILAIECNYSKEIAMRNYEAGLINDTVLKRIFFSHMSLESVKQFLQKNDISKTGKIYLVHLSNLNSNAELFKKEVEGVSGCPVEVCGESS